MYHLAIVDDNETWCFVLALRLEQQGYQVSTFTNVQAFLREVAQFDLVLIDFSMPTPRHQSGMDGPEVICQVKHQLDNPPLLILISSFFTQDLLKEVTDVCPEADAILSKQLATTEILSQIEQLLIGRTSAIQRHSHLQPFGLPTKAGHSIHRQADGRQLFIDPTVLHNWRTRY